MKISLVGALLLTIILMQYPFESASECGWELLLDSKTYSSSYDTFDLINVPPFSSNAASPGQKQMMISFWFQSTSPGSPQSYGIVRAAAQLNGDEVNAQSKRLMLKATGGSSLAAEAMVNNTNKNTFSFGGFDSSWHFALLVLDYIGNFWGVFIYRLTVNNDYQTASNIFSSTINWTILSNLKIVIGGDPYIGSPSQITIQKLQLTLTMDLSLGVGALLATGQVEPLLWAVFKSDTPTQVTNQVTSQVLTIGSVSTDPSWDYSTSSLDFSGTPNKFLKFNPPSGFQATAPFYYWSILFKVNYISQNPTSGCPLFRLFTRRNSVNNNTYIYELGLYKDQIILGINSQYHAIASGIFGTQGVFQTIGVECYYGGGIQFFYLGLNFGRIGQSGVYCNVYLNGTAVQRSSIGGFSGLPPNNEEDSDLMFIGDESCGLPGKVSWVKFLRTDQMTQYFSGCMADCTLGAGDYPGEYACLQPTCASFDHDYSVQNCITCDSSCSNCMGPSSQECVSCASGYLQFWNPNLLCVNTCPNGYYDNSGTCNSCDPSCQTCSNSLNTGCTSCASGKYLSAGKCLNCATGCATCTGQLSNQCSSCQSSLYYSLTNQTCTTCNSVGVYQSGTNCLKCDSSCLTCNQGGPNGCLSCPSGMFYSSTNMTCTSCNTPGVYVSGTSCLACDPSCQTCNGRLSSNCLSCYAGTFYSSSFKTCTACDSSGVYISGSNCSNCDASCQTCNGGGSNQCLSCNSGYYYSPNNHTCTQCNTNGVYIDALTSSCYSCDASCLTCDGSSSTQCLTCPTGSYFSPTNNTCSSCNIQGVYSSGIYCYSCDSSCLTCYGSGPNRCQSCPSSSYYSVSNNTCTSCDAAGVYRLGVNCYNCDSSCETCNQGGPTGCLSCPADSAYISSNNSCTGCSAAGMYYNGTDCKPCDSSCMTCSGPSAIDCQSCYELTYFYTSASTCTACNIPGVYIDAPNCYDCDSTCYTCSEAGPAKCLSCFSGSYYSPINGTCTPCNSNGIYIDGTYCYDCDPSCLTCNRSGSNQCVSCSSGLYYSPENGTCTACNITGVYLNTTTSQCMSCDSSCSTCSRSTSTSCLSCYLGYYYSPKNSTCTTCSGSGVYINDTDCFDCDPSCLSCNGNSSNNCVSCSANLYFSILNSTCTSCNSTGVYISGGNCYNCDPTCRTCKGQGPNNCLRCPSNLFYSPVNETCSTCDPSLAVYSASSNCYSCDPSCSRCFAGGPRGCVTCQSSLLYSPANNTCTTCNSNGVYISGSNCFDCDTSCLTCSGGGSTSCTSCGSPLVLQGNICNTFCYYDFFNSSGICQPCQAPCSSCLNQTFCTSCQGNLYANVTDGTCTNCSSAGYFVQYYMCTTCDPSCSYCNGTESNNCLACTAPLILQGTSCVSSCSAGYYLSQSFECLTCDISCKTCDTTSTTCTNCSAPNFLLSSFCVTPCPDGYYPNSFNQACGVCDQTCATCSESSSLDCLSCPSGSYLSPNGSCSTNVCLVANCNACLPSSTYACQSCQLQYKLSGNDCVESCSSSTLNFSNSNSSCVQDLESHGISAVTVQRANSSISTSTSIVSYVSLFTNLLLLGKSHTFYQFIMLLNLMSFFKFINVQYPLNVLLFLEFIGAGDFGFPNYIQILTNSGNTTVVQNSKDRVAYPILRQFGVSSLFLENYGSAFSLMITLLPIWIICSLIINRLQKAPSNFRGANVILNIALRVKVMIQFNLVINFLLAYLIPLVMGAGLQTRYPDFNSLYSNTSFIVSILAVLALITIVVLLQQNKHTVSQNAWKYLQKHCEILFFDHDDSSQEQPTPLYNITRNIAFVVVIVFLNDFPIPQILFAITVWCFYLSFILRKKPFKSQVQNNITRCTEILLLIALLITSTLIVDDISGKWSSNTRYGVGWVILAILIIALVANLVYQVYEFIRVLRVLWRSLRNSKLKNSQVYPFGSVTQAENLNKISSIEISEITSPNSGFSKTRNLQSSDLDNLNLHRKLTEKKKRIPMRILLSESNISSPLAISIPSNQHLNQKIDNLDQFNYNLDPNMEFRSPIDKETNSQADFLNPTSQAGFLSPTSQAGFLSPTSQADFLSPTSQLNLNSRNQLSQIDTSSQVQFKSEKISELSLLSEQATPVLSKKKILWVSQMKDGSM